ncbi:MAG: rod shape-determining protein MreD [Cocleimonas sp.]
MGNITPRFTGAVLLSIIVAIMLTMLPLNEQWALYRPEWIALTIIHWSLVAPDRMSYVVAWIAGLLLDALYGSIIGQHALGFTIVIFMSMRMRTRLVVDNIFQQFLIIFLVLGTYMLVNLWILGITGSAPQGWDYWLPVVVSILIWPFYHYFMQIYHSRKKSSHY